MNAIETCQLGRRYGRNWALSNCDLTIPEGVVCGLIGPNGAGKTTFLSIATGLLEPSTGTIEVLGGPTPRTRTEQLARVGFVAQDKPLYRSMRVSQLVEYGRHLNPRWDNGYVLDRLSRLRVPLERRVGKLSGGQQAQVALALALGKSPELLLLDEPVANLDPLARRDFLGGLMEGVADTGLSVVLSSHLIADLERVCDYLVLLAEGHVQLCGHTDDLIRSHHVVSGPADRMGTFEGDVIHATSEGRQTVALVRAELPPDPALVGRPPGLEELVLGYMSAAVANADELPRPAPDLVFIGGAS